MQQILIIFMRYSAFWVFMFLQIIAIWLTIQHNDYQRATFISNTNAFVANILAFQDGVNHYFNLKEVNEELVAENARLYESIKQYRNRVPTIQTNELIDSLIALPQKNYTFTPVKVIKNSVMFNNNYILINKGSKDGIKPEMGVVTSNGVVGKVRDCSENFSSVFSLLHTDVKISSHIKRNKELCTVQWDGKNFREASLLFVSRHVDVKLGDTIESSTYNPIFPAGFPIGVINFVEKNPAMTYIDIKIRLFTNFSSIEYAFVVNNLNRAELDSLESLITTPKPK